MVNPELRAEFLRRVPMLESFGNWVTNRVIEEVQKLQGASYSSYFFQIPPRHRVKDVAGFLEKATRQGKNYREPLSDITDQVGTRFVVLLHSHCHAVNDAIRSVQEWDCETAKDIEELRLLNPHHFDYQSYHWTVRPRFAFKLGSILINPEIVCEIQVRTLLQHAYAELAHSTVYKPKASAQPKVKRIIARGAALIETTDCVFEEVAQAIALVTGKLEELLHGCAEWFAANVTNGHYPSSGMALRIADSFSEDLSRYQWKDIECFLAEKSWIAEELIENSQAPLFNDPIILLVFWLVSDLGEDIVSKWPTEVSYLKPIFTKLGISPGNALF